MKSGLTLRWIADVWATYSDTICLSLRIALACVGATLLLGVPAAYVLARRQSRWTRLVEELLVLPVAVPGLATALALILLYGRFGSFRNELALHSGRPCAVHLAVHGALRCWRCCPRSISRRSRRARRASGASFVQRFFGIVLPNAAPGILAGALMVLTLSVGEFNLTWMLHTPLTKTLPVGLADSYASMRLEIGSAYTILFFLMIVPLLVRCSVVARPGAGAAMRPVRDAVPIRLERCAKTFADGTRALEPLDLAIAAGETLVLLGPSGCGKTTTLLRSSPGSNAGSRRPRALRRGRCDAAADRAAARSAWCSRATRCSRT